MHPPPPSITCPRCTYDLTGLAAALPQPAASHGTCSECGVTFEWDRVLRPDHYTVPGFIEHEPRQLLFASWRTWAMALRPQRFWSRVQLEMPPRPARIILWLLLTHGLVLLLAIGIAAGLHALAPAFGSPAPKLPDYAQDLTLGIYIPNFYSTSATRIQCPSAAFLGPLAATLVMPLVFFCLHDTRHVSKVGAGHVLRAAVYSSAWLLPVLLLRGVRTVLLEYDTLALRNSPAGALAMAAAWRFGSVLDALAHLYWPYLLIPTMAWLMLWWHTALKTGLRINEYRNVWLALMIPGFLAALIALALSPEGRRLFGAPY